jgi:two-component system, cell cycle response regulator
VRRSVRRALHVSAGAAAGALACAAVAVGVVDGVATRAPGLAETLLCASLAVLLATAVARRVRFVPPSVRAQRVSFWLSAAPTLADVEVALVLVAATHAVIAATGGAASPAYPLIYAVVAFSVSFQTRAGAWVTVAAALAMEGALLARGAVSGAAITTAALHGVFILGAAAAHAVFLRGLLAAQRRQRRLRLDDEIAEQRRSARDYRLISAALGAQSRAPRSRADEEHMLSTGGVQTISASIYYTLSLIKRSLEARTCVLVWVSDGDELAIKELVTDSELVTEKRRIGAAGALGAVVRDRAALSLPQTRAGQIPYYEGGEAMGAFLGVPVTDGPHLRGVLCADRPAPFDERDAAVLAGATEQLLRIIQTEQVFLAVERAKYEHERFYQASAMLCQALTLEQVMETAFDAAGQIVDYDAAAITLYDREHKRHRVYAVRVAPGAEKLLPSDQVAGLEFRDNSGLAAMVVKNKHYLPAGGELRDITAPIYTKRVKVKDAESLLVLPLLSADEAIGTFMLASRRRHRFGKDVREMLGIIANQVAVSLQNGMMYKQMETMATTDGLTGLTNHRCFQERFGDLLERAARHDHKVAVLLCDVDHFKSVNDTHGHPVGDEVLRKVAKVLQAAVRKIDVPARYGGEEFAVVLDATDEAGAIQLANRIREDIGALVFDSENGAFQVTMSIGVACFPEDGGHRAELIEHADHALYHCKETGRNRVTSYQQFLAARRARKAS